MCQDSSVFIVKDSTFQVANAKTTIQGAAIVDTGFGVTVAVCSCNASASVCVCRLYTYMQIK